MMMPHPLLPMGLPPASVAMAMSQMNHLNTIANMAAAAQQIHTHVHRAPVIKVKTHTNDTYDLFVNVPQHGGVSSVTHGNHGEGLWWFRVCVSSTSLIHSFSLSLFRRECVTVLLSLHLLTRPTLLCSRSPAARPPARPKDSVHTHADTTTHTHRHRGTHTDVTRTENRNMWSFFFWTLLNRFFRQKCHIFNSFSSQICSYYCSVSFLQQQIENVWLLDCWFWLNTATGVFSTFRHQYRCQKCVCQCYNFKKSELKQMKIQKL